MKKIISAVMVFILIFALCACSGAKDSDTSNSTTKENTQPSEVIPSKSANVKDEEGKDVIKDEPDEGIGDTFEEQIPAGADLIAQGVFYYELVEVSGDVGDGLLPREGAELTNDLLASTGLYSDIQNGQCIYISFDELTILDSADGRECYIYSVGLGTPEGGLMGDNYEVIYRVSVDYSGKKTASIYEDFSSEYDGEGLGDMIEADPEEQSNQDGFDVGPNLSYFEEYKLLADTGDYLSAAEAAKLTFDIMRDNSNISDYSDNTQYIMTLVDLTDIEGEECYTYRLDVEDNSTVGAAYAYAYQSGNIYMQGFGGEWMLLVAQSDASEDDIPSWWGEYKNEEAYCAIIISNYNGTSFHFTIYFLRDGHTLIEGVAAVYPDNEFMAEYDDFLFTLSDDYNTIDISVTEGTEWSHLSGSYN